MVSSPKAKQEPLYLHETKLSLFNLQTVCTPSLKLVLTLFNIDNVMTLSISISHVYGHFPLSVGVEHLIPVEIQ